MQFSDLSRLAPAALLAALIAAPAARAQVPAPQTAFQISGGLEQQANNFTNPDNTTTQSFDLGYTFTVNGPVVVTALGFYDDGTGPNGTSLTGSHAVGIFDDTTEQLLVQGTVSSADPYSSLFRYTTALSTPALTLLPGHTYEAVAVTGNDPFDVVGPSFDLPGNPATLSQNAAVNFGEDRTFLDANSGSNDQSTLTYANFSNHNDLTGDGTTNYGYFGPNFQFTAAPEPSQFAGLVLGVLGLGGLMLRARRRI